MSMKVEVEILTGGLRLDGVERAIGEVVELPQSLLKVWEERGYCRLKKAGPPASNITDDKTEETELNHIGGGYYLLPNGEKVQGKKAAKEALNALKGGEENEFKTDSGTDNGTGDNTESDNEGLHETGRNG